MENDKITIFDKRQICTFLLENIIALVFIQKMEKQIIVKR